MERLKTVLSIYPQTITSSAAVAGTGVDTQGYGSCMIEVSVGAAGDTWSTSNKYSLEVLVSDDNSSFSAAADSDLYSVASAGGSYASPSGTVAASGGFKVLTDSTSTVQEKQNYKVGYRGTHRYVAAKVNKAGTLSTGTIFSASVLLGQPLAGPVS
jgi:hypothetical protein